MPIVEELTQRLARLFVAPTLPVDYREQDQALRRFLQTFVTCRRRKVMDQLLDILELLPYFFLSPSLYHNQFEGDWGESLPEAYEDIRAFLDENWDVLYNELKST